MSALELFVLGVMCGTFGMYALLRLGGRGLGMKARRVTRLQIITSIMLQMTPDRLVERSFTVCGPRVWLLWGVER